MTLVARPCFVSQSGVLARPGRLVIDLALGRLLWRGRTAVQESTRTRAQAETLLQDLRRWQPWLTPRRAVTAMIHTDGAGIIRGADEAAGRLLNVPPQRLVGMPLLHFVARQHARAFRGTIKTLGYAVSIEPAEILFRPRHGGRPQRVGTSVERAGPNVYRWKLILRASTSIDSRVP